MIWHNAFVNGEADLGMIDARNDASRPHGPKVLIWIRRYFGYLYDDKAVVCALMAGVAGPGKLFIGLVEFL